MDFFYRPVNRIGSIFICLLLQVSSLSFCQVTDSLHLQEVDVVAAKRHPTNAIHSQTVLLVDSGLMQQHRGQTLAGMLENLPGVQAMTIGAGAAKPVIRGMGFNRIAVIDNGIKHEAQQWGGDHGLEIDPFRTDPIQIIKGPASLIYGSDAMGGVVVIEPPLLHEGKCVYGEANLLGKSVNYTAAASAMLGVRTDRFAGRVRYSEQHYADYAAPVDTITYLSYRIPVIGRRLKNTAGMERDIIANLAWTGRLCRLDGGVSFVQQKAGFFPGAHGIPDITKTLPDGSIWNIDLPRSHVCHLRSWINQKWTIERQTITVNAAWQRNHRQEEALFHSHDPLAVPPARNPDLELDFLLHTASLTASWKMYHTDDFRQQAGLDVQYQHNTSGGYARLLPDYRRTTAGICWMSEWNITRTVLFTAGIRADIGLLATADIERLLGNGSGSIGVHFTPDRRNSLKAHIGRSFRLPTAMELTADGIHHGSFRHEQGDPNLRSEQGWQTDMEYDLRIGRFQLTFSPFLTYFTNYIYMQASGIWSPYPDAGQVYVYTQAPALFAGSELSLRGRLAQGYTACQALDIYANAEYVYTYNLSAHTATPFSPPASARIGVEWTPVLPLEMGVETQLVAPQNRVAHGEMPTPGVALLHAHIVWNFPVASRTGSLTLRAENILDTKFLNHMSYYRHVGISEPGRNIVLSLTLPFHFTLH